ncbi:MAG TPA: DUF3048 domain-containing protein [Clostridiaceae bacterium]
MFKKSLTFMLIISLLLIPGCGHKTVKKVIKKVPPKVETVIPVETKYYAPYTGVEVSKEVLANVAFMSTIENIKAARPLSGLNNADIIYEFMAEGGISRFLAVYQSQNCDKIGPVRSMRTYFVDMAYEYNLPFAHCGGSHDALARITAGKMLDLDQFYNDSAYWRDPERKVQEHSLYTSTAKISALVTSKGYVKEPTVKLSFDKKYWEDKLDAASNINIKFNGSYSASYSFKDGQYYKSMDGAPTLNREDNLPVTVTNVVYQIATYKSRPNELYLDCNLISSGDGFIFSNGMVKKIKWSKASLTSQTILTDEAGKVVPLNPGRTWWHVADPSTQISYN